MPKCIECKWYDKESKECHSYGYQSDLRRVTLIRRCILGAILEEIPMMSGKILEVGFGKIRFLRKHLDRKTSTWYGIEPRWEDAPEKRQWKATASKMPFENEFFDCVLCSQTIEHWHEFGDSIEGGLKEIHRVLKKNGKLFIDVPIHSHGAEVFTTGNPIAIKQLFPTDMWEMIQYDERRKDYEPLPPYEIKEKYHKFAIEISGQKVPSSWMLNMILAKK